MNSTLIYMSLNYRPEHVVEKHGQKMVAYVNSFLDVNVTYHEYKNFLVRGHDVIGNEWYGNGGYDPFTISPAPEPRTYTFYDTQGNLIAKSEDTPSAPIEQESAELVVPDSAFEKPAIIKLDFKAMENREDELVFSVTIDDFVSSYNGFYWDDYEEIYLSEPMEWRRYTEDNAIHSQHETEYYIFSAEENVWSMPTIEIYVPADSDAIQQITLNFDEHGYSEALLSEYLEICYYTLKVLFPDFDDEKIVETYSMLNKLAADNICYESYSYGALPAVLYHKDGVGLYPYYAVGERLHLYLNLLARILKTGALR